ncbi:Haao [Symbiodinium sp. CCMP2592]|nr:Haao [Symbiodinium sp. CCMP2592]
MWTSPRDRFLQAEIDSVDGLLNGLLSSDGPALSRGLTQQLGSRPRQGAGSPARFLRDRDVSSGARLQGRAQTARPAEALQAGSEKRWASDLHNGSQSSYLPVSAQNTQAQHTPVAVHPTIPLPESYSATESPSPALRAYGQPASWRSSPPFPGARSLAEEALRAECAALEASFDDARQEVEHQTRRRVAAERAAATLRKELGHLKASLVAMEAEREGWQLREDRCRRLCDESIAAAEERAEHHAAEASQAQVELRCCREELGDLQREVKKLPESSHSPRARFKAATGNDIEAEVLALCQRLEEEGAFPFLRAEAVPGPISDPLDGRSCWSTTSAGLSDRNVCSSISRFTALAELQPSLLQHHGPMLRGNQVIFQALYDKPVTPAMLRQAPAPVFGAAPLAQHVASAPGSQLPLPVPQIRTMPLAVGSVPLVAAKATPVQSLPQAALPASTGMQRCYSTGSLQQSTYSQTPQVTPCTTPPAVRFFSGVIPNGEAAPSTTLRSALPQPSGYPQQAGALVMVKHHSTASLRSHHCVERGSVIQAPTPTSKDTSPKRASPRGQSQYASRYSLAKSEEETCMSPQSVRSVHSQRSQRSRSFSPKHAEAGSASARSARARSRQNTAEAMSGRPGEEDEEGEAPWEVPYAARTGSQSPRASTPNPCVVRTDSQRRRYQNLYEDHEMRKMKWQAKMDEKKRKEEEELQKSIANTCSPRHFNHEEFQNWYADRMTQQQSFEATRQEKKRSEARLRAFQELSECTFTPMAPSKVSRGPKQRSGSVPMESRPVVHEGDQQATADELVAAQVTQIEAFRHLEKKEREMREATQRVFRDFLERSLEEGRRKLKLFEQTPEGREYLASRAKSYVELNRSMSHSAALTEARGDLQRASEAKLHSHAAQLRQQRAQKDAQQLQLARLKIAWELIQLQRRYTRLEKTLPRSMLLGFDAMLVERLTRESWYVEARSFASALSKEPGSAAMQLAHQCCCGCSLSFGAYFLLSLNLLRCLLFISMACDAVLHQEQDLYIQIEGSLGEKASLCIRGFKACDAYITTFQVALAAFSIAGATFTVFAPASQQGESFELGLAHSLWERRGSGVSTFARYKRYSSHGAPAGFLHPSASVLPRVWSHFQQLLQGLVGPSGLKLLGPVIMSAAPQQAEPPAKRARTDGVVVPSGICALHHIDDWYEQNKAQFSPPVCNKLMHRGQLSIMFVGGPNTRKDFHLEEGSEFFFQLRGNIELPTVQKGKRKLVKINQGQVFCLPSRIPHSPQRPEAGSFGLVVERRREDKEMDGLIYYEDFSTCEKVRWEKFFRCNDLGKDLPPVIEAYKAFEASPAAKQPQSWKEEDRPVCQDRSTEIPEPFSFQDFLTANAEKLAAGESVSLFGFDHPDQEFEVSVIGGRSEQTGQKSEYETWLYQVRGAAHIAVNTGTLALNEGCCCIVQAGQPFDVARAEGSIGLVLRQNSRGNKPTNGNGRLRQVVGKPQTTKSGAGCNDIPASLASNAAHPFACGVERVVWLAFLVMAILIEGYFLFILQSYCQDVVVHLPTKAFGDLYEKSEAHILKKHLNPYSHLYGALPGHGELAGEAVMAAVSPVAEDEEPRELRG